jgi:hypothetical protein
MRSAARLVLRLSARASITDPMRDRLHWLPFHQRVTFKLCTIAFKCIRGTAPTYLSSYCTPVSTIPSRNRLRSAAAGRLTVPPVNMKTVGRRSFRYACPAAWNLLPARLTADLTLSTLKKNISKLIYSVDENSHRSAFVTFSDV